MRVTINTSTFKMDIRLEEEIDKAIKSKNFEFLKDKFSHAIHQRIEELMYYIGNKVINEFSQQERYSFFSDIRCGIGRGYQLYRRNVSMGSCLIKLNLDADMNLNELIYNPDKWDHESENFARHSLLSCVAEQVVKSRDTYTQLNLVMLLLFHNAACIPPLSNQAKTKSFEYLYSKATVVLKGWESQDSLFSIFPKEIICQILRNYSVKAFAPSKSI